MGSRWTRRRSEIIPCYLYGSLQTYPYGKRIASIALGIGHEGDVFEGAVPEIIFQPGQSGL